MDPPGTGSSADGNGWVRLVADDFAAVVSRERLAGGAHASSMLRTLVELATAGGDGAGEPPTVRLDCSAEVARELVAALRQGARYTPPPEPRLARAVADAAAFLGVDAAPALPRGGLEPSEMVLLPSYWYLGLNAVLDGSADVLEAGMLIYSGATRGWATMSGRQDPRPQELRGCLHPHSGGGCWLAATLRSESTGAGEDLAVLVPNQMHSSQRYGDSGVLLRGSLTTGRVAMPPMHKRLGLSSSAMAAAQGKLYLLGGGCNLQVSPATPLEVYDPHIDAWFTCGSPLPGAVTLSEHALVANATEGLLLAFGGDVTSGDTRRHRSTRPFEQMAAFDINAGRWVLNPSGCRWPGGSVRCGVAAAAADPYSIVALSVDDAVGAGGGPRTDVLDLRMWRWRRGAPLQRSAAAAGAGGSAAGCAPGWAGGGGSSSMAGSPPEGNGFPPPPGPLAVAPHAQVHQHHQQHQQHPTPAAAAAWNWPLPLPPSQPLGAAAAGLAPVTVVAGIAEPPSPPPPREDCLLNVGVVSYQGEVLALGGRHYAQDGEWATTRAAAYDPARDAWRTLPPLPFPLCHASPIVMRVPSMLW